MKFCTSRLTASVILSAVFALPAATSVAFEFGLPPLEDLSPIDRLLVERIDAMANQLEAFPLTEHSTTPFGNHPDAELGAKLKAALERLRTADLDPSERNAILREIYSALFSLLNYRYRHDLEVPDDEAALAESLDAIGYLGVASQTGGAQDFPEGGVSLLTGRAADCERIVMGLGADAENTKARTTIVIDREGNVLRTVPDIATAHLMPDGTMYGVTDRLSIVKVSPSNEVVWEVAEKDGRIFWGHHEITVDRNGAVLTLSRSPHAYHGRTVYFDEMVWLSPDDGSVLSMWPVFGALDDLKPHYVPTPLDSPLFYAPRGTVLDMPQPGPEGDWESFHLNAIDVLPPNPLEAKHAAFRSGNYLVSFRNIDLVAILDRETFEVLWSFGPGVLEWQHGPQLIPETGNILIFDNGPKRRRSRVIEIDPLTKEIVWTYDTPFYFTENRGMADRLRNGNTLISISNEGRAIEVTREGEIVWEWKAPLLGANGERAAFYRMMGVEH